MTQNEMQDRPLRGRVAVVTGASRGAGRGIALELGAAGATVYVTGRSTRAHPAESYGSILGMSGMQSLPGSIDDTADEVGRLGGTGIPVRVDHTREDEVRDLFARVEREHGGLDVLVNNAWGGHEAFSPTSFGAPFWEQSLDQWEAMFDRGVRNHLVASRLAAPVFIRQGRGLIVTTSFWDRGNYLRGNLFYDLAKAAMNRLAFGMAQELRPHGVASLAVVPGWMRTEFVLASKNADESTWRDHPEFARTESPRYVGRAVAALAADPDVMRKSGGIHRVADLAVEYGFTDVDGRVVPPFELDEGHHRLGRVGGRRRHPPSRRDDRRAVGDRRGERGDAGRARGSVRRRQPLPRDPRAGIVTRIIPSRSSGKLSFWVRRRVVRSIGPRA
jgi:NAD(P)-dependent dehydrogenase (short-subunit alcohol dehydrogenase family)